MRLILLGAGGHGRVVADIAEQSGKYEEIYFLDDHIEGEQILGVCSDFEKFQNSDTEMYPAFGNSEARLSWAEKLRNAGIPLARIIHPLAYVSPKATIAEGCIVMPYAIVNTGSVVKEVCVIDSGALLDHDCIIEEGCHLAPGAIVRGENHLERGMKVESGEVILPRTYW